MKRIVCFLFTILITASLLSGCEVTADKKYPTPTKLFFVNDYADVIDASAENEIYSRSVALNDKTKAQVVVATVNDLDGEEPADYALGLGREWGVGDKEKKNGVVILFAKNERQIYIAVGEGLEGALPDSKTGRIIDTYGLSYLKEDNFSAGILGISKAIVNEIYIEYNITPEDGYTPIDQMPYSSDGDNIQGYGKKVAYSWVAMIAVIVLYVLIFGRRRRGFIWFGGPPGGFGGFGGFGGGRGGGGFGGFSGGGGSFGGGGAGRGF